MGGDEEWGEMGNGGRWGNGGLWKNEIWKWEKILEVAQILEYLRGI